MKALFIALAFLVIYCDESHEDEAQEAEKRALDTMRADIKKLAEASVCSAEEMCFSVGVGSKPCGGFWEYVVYSSSIDVAGFLTKVETLNELEAAYNERYMIQSDCYVVIPPSRIDCQDGKCVPVYN